MRARLRRFYWKHDRFRRALNLLRSAAVPLCLALGAGIYSGTLAQAARDADQMEGYASSYRDAMDRASKLNDQLRAALDEQKTLRQELRRCQEKQP